MGNRIMGIFFFAFIFLSASVCYAQTPDIFRAEYMMMPKNVQETKLSRIKLVVNLPIKVRDSDNIIIGAEYNNLIYDLQRELPFDNERLRNFHVLDFNLAYVYQYNPEWRFVALVTPRLSSTLENNLQNGDVVVNATVGVIKQRLDIEKPMRLVLGIAYNSSVALRVPLPIVYYEKRFHPNWTYVLGAPKTGLKYHLDEKSQFQTEFILDGYYINLQNNILIPDTGAATSISSSAALVTLGYQYAIKKSMFIYIYAGHTLFQSGVLRDSDRSNIFTLNDGPSFYFRTGFRIGL